MLNPLRVLPHKQTVGGDLALADARPIIMHAQHLAVLLLICTLAEGIGKLVTPTARQNVDSRLLVYARAARASSILRVQLRLASVNCVHGVVIG